MKSEFSYQIFCVKPCLILIPLSNLSYSLSMEDTPAFHQEYSRLFYSHFPRTVCLSSLLLLPSPTSYPTIPFPSQPWIIFQSPTSINCGRFLFFSILFCNMLALTRHLSESATYRSLHEDRTTSYKQVVLTLPHMLALPRHLSESATY